MLCLNYLCMRKMKRLINQNITVALRALAIVVVFALCRVSAGAAEQNDSVNYRYVPLTQEEMNSLIPSELLRAQVDTVVVAQSQSEPFGPFTAMFNCDNKFLRYLDRLATGNKDRSFEKKFDVNFIVMPSYTREGSFGIGGGATGLYRLDRTDSIMQPSDITVIGNVTLNGFASLTASGNIHFPGRRLRYSYKLEYTYSPLNFWGITRDACGVNPQTKWTKSQLKYTSDLVYRLSSYFNVGALLDLTYSHIIKLDNADYLEGQDRTHFFTTVGAVLQFDTRDFILQPRRGMNLMLRFGCRPQFLGTYNRSLFNGSITYNYYQPLWKGCLLAVDAYASVNSKESPWALREALGSGGIRMRGYYSGRYIDNDFASVQAELRQHLFPRVGVALWGGIGNVFPSIGRFRSRDLLANGGIGLRIEMKHNVNGRIDFGIGRNTCGFVFAIGEAF